MKQLNKKEYQELVLLYADYYDYNTGILSPRDLIRMVSLENKASDKQIRALLKMLDRTPETEFT